MKKLLVGLMLATMTCLALAQDRESVFRQPLADPGKNVAYTGTAGSTGVFAPGATSVLVWCTSDCYVVVGDGVTATTSDTPIPSFTPIWLPVPRSGPAPWRVSAIQISSGGTVYAKPFN